MNLSSKQIIQLISLFLPIIAGVIGWLTWQTWWATGAAILVGGIISAIIERVLLPRL